jgi:predicted ABC-type ATPase
MARYDRTLANLKRAIARLPRISICDNSRFENPYRLVAEVRSGELHRQADGELPEWCGGILKGEKG